MFRITRMGEDPAQGARSSARIGHGLSQLHLERIMIAFIRLSLSAFALIGAATVADRAAAQTADRNGCYTPPRQCVRGEVLWLEGGRLLTARMTNNCPGRIYIKFCNLRRNGTQDCGADGLAPGRTKAWSTYNAVRPARSGYRYTGSLRGGSDWVCAGRVPGWNNDLRL